ncbi:hypothetical protein NUW54_g4611 [Trametes sanguinea]|uniref:Uncharacterized protein n=1 Tax=Trametes sanguinea TaxID=158606 RepID=A0ACC1PXJ9_9APHY|nr:hypothetical protein NUW54_g4611 [Trametes sanguinea]
MRRSRGSLLKCTPYGPNPGSWNLTATLTRRASMAPSITPENGPTSFSSKRERDLRATIVGDMSMCALMRSSARQSMRSVRAPDSARRRNNADVQVIRSQTMRKDRTGFTLSTQLRPGTPAGSSHPSSLSVGDADDSAATVTASGSTTGLIISPGDATASSGALSAKAAQHAIVQEVDSGFRVPIGGGTLPPPYTAD